MLAVTCTADAAHRAGFVCGTAAPVGELAAAVTSAVDPHTVSTAMDRQPVRPARVHLRRRRAIRSSSHPLSSPPVAPACTGSEPRSSSSDPAWA